MSPALPRSIVISAWLNSWRNGDVTTTDAANAFEVATEELSVDIKGTEVTWLEFLGSLPRPTQLFSPALAIPGDPCGLPVAFTTEGVALSPDALLAPTPSWQVLNFRHTIIPIDFPTAGRLFHEALAQAAAVLNSLDTVGSREELDAALDSVSREPLPPTMESRRHDLLDRAQRIRLVTQRAQFEIPSSRSQEAHAVAALRTLERATRFALAAAVTY